MMRMDGRREVRRPRSAVLRPLGLLVAAAVTGFGMWHALMHDDRPAGGARLSQHDRHLDQRLLPSAGN
jgi:hypothetical protein